MSLSAQHRLTSALALATTFALTLAAWQPAVTGIGSARVAAGTPAVTAPTVHAASAPIVLM